MVRFGKRRRNKGNPRKPAGWPQGSETRGGAAPGVSGKSGVRPRALNPAVQCDGAKAGRRPLDLQMGSGSDLSKGQVVACRSGGRRGGLWSEGRKLMSTVVSGPAGSGRWEHGQQPVLGVRVCLGWRSRKPFGNTHRNDPFDRGNSRHRNGTWKYLKSVICTKDRRKLVGSMPNSYYSLLCTVFRSEHVLDLLSKNYCFEK